MKQRRLFYTILLLLSMQWGFRSMCQSHKIDSLRRVLATEKEDTNKVKTYLQLLRQLQMKNRFIEFDSVAKKSLQLSQILKFNLGLGETYLFMGIGYYFQNNYSVSLKNLLLSLNFYQLIGNKKGMGVTYTYIGDLYKAQGNYPIALINQLQALKIDKEIGNKDATGSALGEIGMIYSSLNNNVEAMKYLMQALALFREKGDKFGIAAACSNIGIIYDDEKNYNEALTYQFEAEKLFEKIGNKYGSANTNACIGDIYLQNAEFRKASEYFLQELKIDREIGEKRGIGNAIKNIGEIYLKTSNYILAKLYLDSANTIGEKICNKELLRNVYDNYVEYDSVTGNFKKSLADYKSYIVYRDSLKNEEMDRKILNQQMSFDFAQEQDSAKAVQEKKDAIAATDNKRQAAIRNSFIAGFIITLALLFFIFRGYRQKQKDNLVILKQKREVEQQKAEVEKKNLVIEEINKNILDSITYAKRLQDAILPPLSIVKQYLPDSFLIYKPKDIVAGDFYWMEISGDNILIAACDCTGHGVPGAMVSVVCSNALNRAVKEFHITETGKILDKTRELVLETFAAGGGEVKDGMDCSFCAINTLTRRVEWSGAYNPLWYITNGEMKKIYADKQPIGSQDVPTPFNSTTLNLQKGDLIYLVTDGYADQFGGPKGKKFKDKQLQELLKAEADKPMNEQKNFLERKLDEWKGDLEQVDDILIIGIRV